MKLIQCHIENFGGLSDVDFSFEDGLTVLYQPNGFGKSTLAAFIKAMFYGFSIGFLIVLEFNPFICRIIYV